MYRSLLSFHIYWSLYRSSSVRLVLTSLLPDSPDDMISSRSGAAGMAGCGVLQRVAMYCRVWQCVAMRCSVLQWVAVRYCVLQCVWRHDVVTIRRRWNGRLQCAAACCSVLQCVAECCRVLQSVAVFQSVLRWVLVRYGVLQCVSRHNIVTVWRRWNGRLQCVTVCCSELQCVIACYSVLQCVAMSRSALRCVTVCFTTWCRHGPALLEWQAAVRCSVLQWVAVCYSVSQCVTSCCSMFHDMMSSRTGTSVLHNVASCCSMLQYVAVCHSALKCGRTSYYGVAPISRLLKIIGLFCRISSLS